VQEHQKHLGLVFNKLKEHEFYLREEKCELFMAKVNCLGHMVDKKGLHIDTDKMAKMIGVDCVTIRMYKGFWALYNIRHTSYQIYSDFHDCPNVLHFWNGYGITLHRIEIMPKCWCEI